MHPWLTVAARIGHVSVGIVYVLIGAVAVAAAVDMRIEPTDSLGIFRILTTHRFGVPITVALVCGLVIDAIWQGAQAVAPRRGSGVAALVQRVVSFGSGAIHLGLAIAASRVVSGARQLDGDTAARQWSSWILAVPHGETLVAVAGVATLAVAVVMIYRAWSSERDRSVHWPTMNRTARRVTFALNRVGLAARAVTCGIVGAFLLVVAAHENPSDARALAGAFRTVRYTAYGDAAIGLLGSGFLANGITELVRARYRRRAS